MIFEETPLKGAYIVRIEPIHDNRGFYSRAFCSQEFEEAGLPPTISQLNYLHTEAQGTLRGLHCQISEEGEAKYIRCVQGSIYDVIIDIREDSPTYLQSYQIELNTSNRLALYIPPFFAHGFLTLEDNTDVIYSTSVPYSPSGELGICYDDPYFSIPWPQQVKVISEKDQSWPLFEPNKGTL